ncbi:FUSC family protein [Paraburkholderia sp. BCC1884]|uniref:FUSC family protein n=1 Tax=Paraburkholderia sp. BCC1884 TaxID=2562668 RepID=UPI0021B3CB90|nr:FUSC family protein [Paraburkholderia sp. BCC1884]
MESTRPMLEWPAPLIRFAAFLRTELAPYPGRGNVTLRCVLGGAFVIIVSMTLRVPELPLSLLVIFYVTQSNIVLTRVIAANLVIGVTFAVACVVALYAIAFGYPMLRILIASAIFFCGVYLMRAVTRFGLVFFLVSLIVIYAQSFGDLTDNTEMLVRSCLWVWAAVNYPVVTALILNTVLLPAEPERQLRAAMQRLLTATQARLATLADARGPLEPVSALALQVDTMTLQKLLRFTTMRRHLSEAQACAMLASVAAVSRIVEAAAYLPERIPAAGANRTETLRTVQGELASMSLAIGDDAQWPRWNAPARAPLPTSIAGVDMMERTLSALADATRGETGGPASTRTGAPGEAARNAPARTAFFQPDALTNPRYARFALRTLLSVLICYVFYNAVKWPGIHTIMLTSLIVALPSLGASARQGILRVGGALTGSGLALFMVAFVIPHLESISGLLLMALPVIALGAWLSAGSERIGYAGTQIMFTFSLALLVSFSPPSDLTEIRDRIVGILLGVGVAIFIQTWVWPEGEGDALRAQLASVLREIAAVARTNATKLLRGATASQAQAEPAPSTLWGKLADCSAMLARVALEPDWREGDIPDVTILSQAVLAQGRALLLAVDAFNAEATLGPVTESIVPHAAQFQTNVADALDHYADGLAMQIPDAMPPLPIDFSALGPFVQAFAPPRDANARTLVWHARRIDGALAGLPRWTANLREIAEQPVHG